MVKRLLTLILIIDTLLAVGQQNLVPNPSFEQLTSCPDSPGDIALASPWFQPSILNSSSDLFNVCSISTSSSVPYNNVGHQYPRTGAGYAGIEFWEDGFDIREYIEVKLIEPLKKNKKYCIEFYVSLADSCNYGVSNIGVYFSTDSVLHNPTTTPVINYTSQVNNLTGAIVNKNSWVLISGTFIANGNEQFITIGNFFSNTNTTTQFIGDPGDFNFTYYYIDDVSVTCCDESGCDGLDDLPNVFTPNGDGLNDVFSIDASAFESISCEIYNRWGIKVTLLNEGNPSWDGRTTSGQEALEGVYYYVVRARNEKGEETSRTGFVQLLR